MLDKASRTAAIVILSLIAMQSLIEMRSFNVGFRCYGDGSYYLGFIIVLPLLGLICWMTRKIWIPVAGLFFAIALVHVSLSAEEAAFKRRQAGSASEPTPRFIKSCWFAVDEQGNLHGGD